MRKYLHFLLFLTSVLLWVPSSKADHIVGSDITYRCIDSNNYAFTLKFYRDCNGCYVLSQPNPCGTTENCNSSATAPTSLSVTGAGGSCDGSSLTTLSMTRQSIVDITPTCKTERSRCQQPCGSTYPYGIEEHTFTGTLNVANIRANGCCKIRISVTLSVRSAIITTGQQQQNFFTFAEVDLCASPCNNSPALTNRPIAIVCCNQPYFFNNGAVDSLDRDSISFHMVPPMTGASSNATFAAGLSTNTPVPVYQPGLCTQVVPIATPPIGFYLDSLAGDLVFTPASNGCTPVGCPWIGILAMEMREWRRVNGNLVIVGRTRRDMQFIAQNCPGNNPPTMIGQTTHSVCEGSTLCFNITTNDVQFTPPPPATAAPPDTVTLNWNAGISGATFNIIDPTARLQSGRFCWTPKIGQASSLPYVFTATARDNACPINASVTKAYKITVKRIAKAQRTYTILPCGKVRIHATPEDIYTNSYLWTIRDSVNSPVKISQANKSVSVKQTDTIQFKKGGKYIVILTANNPPLNCSNIYIDTIIVPEILEVDLALGNDTFVCAGNGITLSAKVKNGYTPYRYLWSTSANDTSTTKSFLPAADSTVSIRVSDNNGCFAYDTIKVRYIVRPVIDLGPDKRICDYDSTTFDAGNTDNKKKIQWSSSDTTSIIKVNAQGTYIVRVTDTLGCDSRDTVELFVNDHVSADAGPDKNLCLGDTIKLGASGADNSGGKTHQYTWSLVSGSNQYSINGDTTTAWSNSNSIFALRLQTTQQQVTCEDMDSMEITSKQLPDIDKVKFEDRCYDYGQINLEQEGAFTPMGGYFYAQNPALVTGGKNVNTQEVGNKDATTQTWIYYTYTDNFGCRSVDSLQLKIFRLPAVVAKDTLYCQNVGIKNLRTHVIQPVITNGTQDWVCLNEPGVVTKTGNNFFFDPTYRPAPIEYTLVYTYTDLNNCVNRDTIKIRVIDVPVIAFGQARKFCMDEGSVDLSVETSVTPAFGKWFCAAKPNLVKDSSFLETGQDSGTYWFSYVHRSSGCFVIDSIQLTINPLPKVVLSFPPNKQNLCKTELPFSMIGWPAGGTYSSPTLPGIITPNGTVDPGKKDDPNTKIQTYSLNYKYTNSSTGCKSEANTTVTIQEAPSVTINVDPTEICEGDSFKGITAVPVHNSTGVSWTGGSGGQFSNPNQLVSNYKPNTIDVTNGSVTVTVTTNPDGVCPVANASVNLPIWPLPTGDFSVNDQTECAPLNAEFLLNSNPANGMQYLWDFGDGASSTAKNPSHVYDKEGLFTVSVRMISEHNCTTSLKKDNYIAIHPVPNALFGVDPSTHYSTIALPKFNFINKSTVSTGNLNYAWDFGLVDLDSDTSSQKNPVFFYGSSEKDTGLYIITLIVTTDEGCTDIHIDSIRIGPDLTVFIPNAFTPNTFGEPINNRFRVSAQGFSSFEINIFNRWGEKLYTSKDIKDGWDGTYKGQACPQDVYVYQVNVTGMNGKVYKYNGTVTLLR